MQRGSSGARHRAVAFAVLLMAACALLGVSAGGAAAASQGTKPNLASASAYLVAPANLVNGHYYESFPGTADFGLTIDGALALAATGDEDAALRKIVGFLAADGKDPSGDTVDEWTGIGTSDASGGSIGKEALMAEVVGRNPESFGGRNLIAAVDASVCPRASTGGNTSCPAAGSFLNDTSVFDQALGIMAQLRAGQVSEAAAPVRYLESLQNANGSFPSLIPPSGGPDVDSSAMAVMALALAPGARAAGDVAAGLQWIASRQQRNGGFPGMGAESINSTGLAIQALSLRAGAYRARIGAAEAFLAGQQNGNGGFNADAGQPGSNLRASTQGAGGAVGTSFGTLRIDLSGQAHPARSAAHSPEATQPARYPASHPAVSQSPSARGQGTSTALLAPLIALAVIVVVAAALILVTLLRRRRRRRAAGPPAEPADPATHDQVSS
jgi:Prenyltransferase and squalene oxidase repeat